MIPVVPVLSMKKVICSAETCGQVFFLDSGKRKLAYCPVCQTLQQMNSISIETALFLPDRGFNAFGMPKVRDYPPDSFRVQKWRCRSGCGQDVYIVKREKMDTPSCPVCREKQTMEKEKKGHLSLIKEG